jgi:hypothetical protein
MDYDIEECEDNFYVKSYQDGDGWIPSSFDENGHGNGH